MIRGLLLLLAALSLPSVFAATPAIAPIAAKPLFRDPVFDGAADPIVVWNPHKQCWWMYYTNRRANVPGLSGVAWVHGTKIGIAESTDQGTSWSYLGTADIEIPKELGGSDPTQWAPDIVTSADGVHHMFLTIVPGTFEDWNHPRTLVHLTSTDLLHWANATPLTLASDRVIDACVQKLPDGTWRLWYNNERDHKAIYYADSPDLITWTDKGKCEGTGARPAEGPYVFTWKGRNWMIVDLWKGLGVFSSTDFVHWVPQNTDLLKEPGQGTDDEVMGGHAGVVLSGDYAYLFYFTHPERTPAGMTRDKNTLGLRRSSIQVVELFLKDGQLSCDRDKPTQVLLTPNPLIEQRADPYVYHHSDGFYYFMATVPEYDRLELRRASRLEDLGRAEPKTIWKKHATGPMGSHVWAPELHFIDGKWFIYFAAGEAEKIWNIRIYVLENASANPLEGEWIERGQLHVNRESFTLDATTFEIHGIRYLVWAQDDPAVKHGTDLYIARMDSPTSITGKQVRLSKPELPWEQVRYPVNEGPAVLIKNGRVFLSYSAAGTGAEYCMGMLTAEENADLLDPKSWQKAQTPVFATSEANGIYGPGHNSFTTSPDGKETLMVYHARNYREIKGDPLRDPNRHARIQPVSWRPDGTPDFGIPSPESK